MDVAPNPLSVRQIDDADLAGVVVLAVVGELDLATVADFKDAVRGRFAGGDEILLELSGLGFCDSTGLGALVGLYKIAREAGVRLAVASPRSQVADVLALSGVDQVVEVFESLSAARTALARR